MLLLLNSSTIAELFRGDSLLDATRFLYSDAISYGCCNTEDFVNTEMAVDTETGFSVLQISVYAARSNSGGTALVRSSHSSLYF